MGQADQCINRELGSEFTVLVEQFFNEILVQELVQFSDLFNFRSIRLAGNCCLQFFFRFIYSQINVSQAFLVHRKIFFLQDFVKQSIQFISFAFGRFFFFSRHFLRSFLRCFFCQFFCCFFSCFLTSFFDFFSCICGFLNRFFSCFLNSLFYFLSCIRCFFNSFFDCLLNSFFQFFSCFCSFFGLFFNSLFCFLCCIRCFFNSFFNCFLNSFLQFFSCVCCFFSSLFSLIQHIFSTQSETCTFVFRLIVICDIHKADDLIFGFLFRDCFFLYFLVFLPQHVCCKSDRSSASCCQNCYDRSFKHIFFLTCLSILSQYCYELYLSNEVKLQFYLIFHK